MGNQTSYVNEQVISMDGKLEDNLECIGSKQHKYLGLIQLWRRDSKSKPTIFSKQSHSGQRHDLNVNDHNDRKKVYHPNILQYYGSQSNYLTFKGNILQTKFFFEYIPNTLDNVINFHKKNCSYLEESEIWKIILQIVSACSFLSKLDKFHGDLNPQTIFIDNQKQVKILYHNAYPEIITSYAKLLAYQDTSVYISPQQLDDLVNQSVTPQDDPLKTDSFQLGLTLLELMTMTSILEDCIDYKRKTIYYKSIMDLLSSARKRYSQQLINLIQKLITFDEQSRPTLSDILFETNLQQQQGTNFLPQSKIRRYIIQINYILFIHHLLNNLKELIHLHLIWDQVANLQFKEIYLFNHILELLCKEVFLLFWIDLESIQVLLIVEIQQLQVSQIKVQTNKKY